MSATPTIDALKALYVSAVRRQRAMPPHVFAKAIINICGDVGDDATVAEALARTAAQGSVDAAAALMVLSDADPALDRAATDALRAILSRIEDIGVELLAQELENQMVEWEREGFAERVGVNAKGNTLWRFTEAGNRMLAESKRGEAGAS